MFFINIHTLQQNEVTERIKSLSVPNFLQSSGSNDNNGHKSFMNLCSTVVFLQ